MRIAFVSETFLPNVDGVVRTLCRVLEHLEPLGHEALVLAPSGAPPRVHGAEVVGLSGFRFPLYPAIRLVPPTVDLRRRLERFRPDVVHVLNPLSLGIAALRQARAMEIPVVASFHTDLAGFARRWGLGSLSTLFWPYLRWIHAQADLNLCPSPTTLRLLESQGFPRLDLWTRGVDTARFHPGLRSPAWRAKLSGLAPDAPLVLYAGRLSPEKRVEWCRDLLFAAPGVRLAIVGDGPSRASLERLFDGTPTVFTGMLHGEDLARAYASADVLVYPGAEETFGNVVLEAMASGLPVVAARAGGPLDIIEDGTNGLLFDAEERASLVACVSRLLADGALSRRIGAAGRREALQREWPKVLDGLLDTYRSLLPAAPAVLAHHRSRRRTVSRRQRVGAMASAAPAPPRG
jgi:glycosyltransferase involved in cell wall biosynthesis